MIAGGSGRIKKQGIGKFSQLISEFDAHRLYHVRMAYSWLIIDQETSLLQDTPSTLSSSISDVEAPVPSPDATWQATSSKEWAQQLAQSGISSGNSLFRPSLSEHVRCFRETGTLDTPTEITPLILRLLLCHIQNLVSQVRISISSISSGKSFKLVRRTSMVLLSVHLDEAQDLLQKWLTLAKRCASEQPEASPTICAAMILYHFVALNTLVNFPEIERFARGEAADQPSAWKRPHHFEDTQLIYFHCGQILRIIRSMPGFKRPSWWAGAVYRAALIAWANSMSSPDSDSHRGEHAGSSKTTQVVMLDSLPAEHPLIEAYLTRKEGTPVFSGASGSVLSLEQPGRIIRHCAKLLGPDLWQTTFVRGVRQKLMGLAGRWEESELE